MVSGILDFIKKAPLRLCKEVQEIDELILLPVEKKLMMTRRRLSKTDLMIVTHSEEMTILHHRLNLLNRYDRKFLMLWCRSLSDSLKRILPWNVKIKAKGNKSSTKSRRIRKRSTNCRYCWRHRMLSGLCGRVCYRYYIRMFRII